MGQRETLSEPRRFWLASLGAKQTDIDRVRLFLGYTNLQLNLEQQSRTAIASALAPETWPFSLDWLPPASYLVGGNVRDALLGRRADYLDLDFVLPSRAIETARAIASHYKAGFVLLDVERQIARVVFRNATVDFAQQMGPSLESDLQRRDFTVNAIAYNPHTDQLLDPQQGYLDLRQRQVRMIAPENLKEDPLRLLRAYRQAAQLGFTLEPSTRATIQHLAPLLSEIAAERVQAELNYLLSTAKGTPFLQMAWDDQLLVDWLPHATALGIEHVGQVDRAALVLEQHWPTLGSELGGWVRDQNHVSGAVRSWLKVAKLTCLTDSDAAIAEQDLWQLKYSRAEVQAVMTLHKVLPQMQESTALLESRREQYFFFKAVGSAFPAAMVLALATAPNNLGENSSIAMGSPLQEKIAPLIKRFLDEQDPVAHPSSLLTGRELMHGLHISPGPRIGQLLSAIQLAHAEGKINTAQEALIFASTLLEKS